jgi:hypothetical protein
LEVSKGYAYPKTYLENDKVVNGDGTTSDPVAEHGEQLVDFLDDVFSVIAAENLLENRSGRVL